MPFDENDMSRKYAGKYVEMRSLGEVEYQCMPSQHKKQFFQHS